MNISYEKAANTALRYTSYSGTVHEQIQLPNKARHQYMWYAQFMCRKTVQV